MWRPRWTRVSLSSGTSELAKVFAKTLHVYEDRGTHRHWWIPAGEWREVPDDIASYLIAEHPEKLSYFEDQTILNTEMSAPVDREMKPRRRKVA